jgi:hypothetical protein
MKLEFNNHFPLFPRLHNRGQAGGARGTDAHEPSKFKEPLTERGVTSQKSRLHNNTAARTSYLTIFSHTRCSITQARLVNNFHCESAPLLVNIT